jgi:C1A family cysteine protease
MPGIHRLGWVRDLPDHRDFLYAAPLHKVTPPPKVDLRPAFGFSPYDQGRIGSCTANAIAGGIQYDRHKARQEPSFLPSRLFIYYLERALEHTIALDAGAQIRDGMKSVAKYGVCPETLWPYDGTPADESTRIFPPDSRAIQKPSAEANKEAAKYKLTSYFRVVQSLKQLQGCLAEGYPFVFGFAVFDSLWDDAGEPKTTVPLPTPSEAPVGGHAVLAVGYDDEQRHFIVRNSWGADVQDGGHFYLPYAYITDKNLADDFWTIRAVSG